MDLDIFGFYSNEPKEKTDVSLVSLEIRSRSDTMPAVW